MKIKDLKDMRDLRDVSTNDVVDLLDELRVIASKRGTELFEQGRTQARRALGAPDGSAVTTAFVVGLLLGAAAAALATLLMTPMPGREARKRLTKQVETLRERSQMHPDGNGRSIYESPAATTMHGGSIASPTA